MSRWIFEPGHTAATFKAKHMMVTWVRGHFKDVHGSIDWDPDSPLDTTFEGTMALDKMSTGEPERDAHLRSADFFDADNHGEISFRGTLDEQLGQTHLRGPAELTIRGTTRTVRVDAHYLGQWSTPFWEGDENKGQMRRIGFEVSAEVDRTDFGVSWNDSLDRGGVVASNCIPIVIDVEAILEDDMRAVGALGKRCAP